MPSRFALGVLLIWPGHSEHECEQTPHKDDASGGVRLIREMALMMLLYLIALWNFLCTVYTCNQCLAMQGLSWKLQVFLVSLLLKLWKRTQFGGLPFLQFIRQTYKHPPTLTCPTMSVRVKRCFPRFAGSPNLHIIALIIFRRPSSTKQSEAAPSQAHQMNDSVPVFECIMI